MKRWCFRDAFKEYVSVSSVLLRSGRKTGVRWRGVALVVKAASEGTNHGFWVERFTGGHVFCGCARGSLGNWGS